MLTSSFVSKKGTLLSPDKHGFDPEEDSKMKTQTPKKIKEGPDFDLLQQYLLDAEDSGIIIEVSWYIETKITRLEKTSSCHNSAGGVCEDARDDSTEIETHPTIFRCLY